METTRPLAARPCALPARGGSGLAGEGPSAIVGQHPEACDPPRRHIGDFRDLPPDEQAHVERALLKHMEEYEQTTDLLEELVDIVQTANRVHEEHGKASVESFTVDRAIAAAVDAAIFLVQKQNQALLGGGRAQALPQAE